MQLHIVFRWVAAALLLAVIFVSFVPGDSVDPYRVHMGESVEIGHVIAYAILFVTSMFSIARLSRTVALGSVVVLALSLFGLAIELLQPLAGRTTSIVDFAENETGIGFGIVFFLGCLLFERIRTDGYVLMSVPAQAVRKVSETCDKTKPIPMIANRPEHAIADLQKLRKAP